MSGRAPDEIWEDALDEGERRLCRSWLGLAATGFAGGAEVAFGILSVAVISSVTALVAPEQTAHVIGSLLVGFLLAAPTLNHAVVAFGKISFGLIAGTTHATTTDLVRNTLVAIAGNLVGGIGLVFATRIAQVRGEPDTSSGFRPSG